VNIAIDVDGVITAAPDFWAVVTAALRRAGHRVYVISDFAEAFRPHRERELADYGIDYDAFEITSAKQDFCRANGIDFAIDDQADEYFPDVPAIALALIPVHDARGG